MLIAGTYLTRIVNETWAVYAIRAAHGRPVFQHQPAWLCWIFGDVLFSRTRAVYFEYSTAGAEYLRSLPHLEEVGFTAPSMRDSVLQHVEGLQQLRSLIIDSPFVTDAGLRHVSGLTNLESLDLGQTPVTDAGMRHLGRLARLRQFHAWNPRITDAGLRYLVNGSPHLEILQLQELPITDSGLEAISSLSELVFLNLRRTKATDAGLTHLKGMKHLREVVLDPTRMTKAGAEDLRRALPGARIVFGPFDL
jgi:hypothetical protein